MKRYNPHISRDSIMRLIPYMEESSSGEYVQYEDVQALIQWMKNKAEAWKNLSLDINCQSGYFTDVGETYSDCAEELEQKLHEIGEL